MLTKVEGIILKETPYSNTSKIISLYTREYGLISVLCKGAKRLNSPLRANTIKYTYGYFHIMYKEDKLSTLTDVDIINNLTNIKTDIVNVSYLGYMSELTMQVLKQTSDDLFDIFINAVLKLNENMDPLVITNILEIKYLPYLGIGLNLEGCCKCGNQNSIVTIDGDAGGYICSNCLRNEKIVDTKVLQMLRMYYYVDIKSISELKISKSVKNEINNFLNTYYDRYSGLYLYSKDFLKSLSKLG